MQEVRPDLRRLRLLLRTHHVPKVPRQLQRGHQGALQGEAQCSADPGLRAAAGREARRAPGAGGQRREARGGSVGGRGERAGEGEGRGPPGERDGIREASVHVSAHCGGEEGLESARKWRGWKEKKRPWRARGVGRRRLSSSSLPWRERGRAGRTVYLKNVYHFSVQRAIILVELVIERRDTAPPPPPKKRKKSMKMNSFPPLFPRRRR